MENKKFDIEKEMEGNKVYHRLKAISKEIAKTEKPKKAKK